MNDIVKKVAVVGLAGMLGSVSSFAFAKDAVGAGQIQNALLRVTTQTAANELEDYQKFIKEIRTPSFESLEPVLEPLADLFKAGQTEEESRRIAFAIAQPTWTGWNNYRKIDIDEIFNEYIPADHQNSKIASLEYNVRKYTMPRNHENQLDLLKAHPQCKKFVSAFNNFVNAMKQPTANGKNYRPHYIIHQMAPVITEYNALVEKNPAWKNKIKDSFFKHPFATSWQKTATVQSIREGVGMIWYTEGADYRSAQNLQQTYQENGKVVLSEADAQLFADFVQMYDKNANQQASLLKGHPQCKRFMSAYDGFVHSMQQANANQPHQIIHQLAPVITEFNALVAKNPAWKNEIKDSFFKQPFTTAWQKSVTVQSLKDDLGIIEYTEGAAYRSAENLQQSYQVNDKIVLSNEDAQLFAAFVKTYNDK